MFVGEKATTKTLKKRNLLGFDTCSGFFYVKITVLCQ
jgi:hypothetical protein